MQTNKPSRTRLPVLLAGLALAGCSAVGPDYRAPALDVPTAWNRVEPEAQPLIHTEAPEDLSAWWRNLNDPLLSSLVAEALQAGPEVRSARARLRAARGRRVMAAADRFPGVTASATASRSDSSVQTLGSGTRDFFSAGFDANWELDVFGRVRRSVEAANADLASSVASLNDTQVSLASEVALTYVEVRALQTRLAIALANLASQSETLQLADWRVEAGLVSSQDAEQARSNREQTRAQIPSLQADLAEAEHRLDILLGRTPGTLHPRLVATRALPVVPERIAVGIPADTLRQRPDVRAAERTLAAETARVGVAEAARYPSFNLSGSIGLEALTFSALGDNGASTSLLAGLASPIFNAGRLRAQVDIQDAVREQALVAYEQTVLSALQEVENALVALARSRERERALARAVEAARNAALMAEQRYSAGLIDFQPVLDTQRSVLSVEDSLASTRANGVAALIRLYKALGGGWTPQPEIRPVGKDIP